MSNRLLNRLAVLTLALSVTTVAACDDDDDPMSTPMPNISASTTAADLGNVNKRLGATASTDITITNSGSGTLNITGATLAGTDAADFAIVSGGGAATLTANQSQVITVSYTPSAEAAAAATLTVASDDPDTGSLVITLSGTGAVFMYDQVDRMGIPALNTVFNHPSGTAPFDKTAYNVASPDADLATYKGQFNIVLEAVGNADTAATSTLLLPDALPVNMGAATNTFASLTGRALADDATDVALSVTVGIAALQSDNVDMNDVAFLTDFPYLADPHTP